MGTTSSQKNATGSEGRLSREVQNTLGRLLEEHYNKIVSEGIPERFTEFLSRLESEQVTDPPAKVTDPPAKVTDPPAKVTDPAAKVTDPPAKTEGGATEKQQRGGH